MHNRRPAARLTTRQTAPIVLADGTSRRSQFLQAFHYSFRRKVDELAQQKHCFAELAETFPALLFALATDFGTAEARKRAIAHLEAGSRLREAAKALGVPWWMRKLPPQAFKKRLEQVPDDPLFAKRIVDLFPANPGMAAKWLDRVFQAYRLCGPEFALWVARHERFHAPLLTDPPLPYVAAWAWFAGQKDTLGHQLLRRPWTPSMSPRRAFDELTAWRKRIRLALTLSALNRQPWLQDGTALGYEFVELKEIRDFIAESEAMDNCLDSFSEKLEQGTCYVFSIRKNGTPVADVEIGAHAIDPNVPTIVQLRAPRNARAHPQIWRATFAWLGSQELCPAPSHSISRTARRQAWRRLWRPYLATLDPADRAEVEHLVLELEKLQPRRRRPRQSTNCGRGRQQPPLVDVELFSDAAE